MSGKRFDRINECIKLDHEEESPENIYTFFWIRKMKKGFNDKMATEFNPSWIACVDERMVAFYNAHITGFPFLDRNSYPLVNEHHTISCFETKIEIIMKIVKGKDKPLEYAHASL